MGSDHRTHSKYGSTAAQVTFYTVCSHFTRVSIQNQQVSFNSDISSTSTIRLVTYLGPGMPSTIKTSIIDVSTCCFITSAKLQSSTRQKWRFTAWFGCPLAEVTCQFRLTLDLQANDMMHRALTRLIIQLDNNLKNLWLVCSVLVPKSESSVCIFFASYIYLSHICRHLHMQHYDTQIHYCMRPNWSGDSTVALSLLFFLFCIKLWPTSLSNLVVRSP